MASVTVRGMWLHDLADLTSCLYVPVHALDGPTEARIEVRPYAGGVMRVIEWEGVQRPTRVRSNLQPLPIVEQLERWVAHPLLVRLPNSRMLTAVYGAVGRSDWKHEPVADVTLTFREFTHPEAV